MTKAEYLSAFGRELKRLGVADAGDVLEEYEQHFEFKGRDGCTEEEEVSARLATPPLWPRSLPGPGQLLAPGRLRPLDWASCGYSRLYFLCCSPRGRL